MDAKVFGAIFIAVVMIGSMIAFPLALNQQNSQPPVDDSINDPTNNQNVPAVEYRSSGVDATVERLLPTVRISAESKSFDLEEIRFSLLEINGVNSVLDLGFGQKTQDNPNVPFAATLVVGEDFDYDTILDDLRIEREYEAVFVYPRAMFKVPQTIEISNEELSLARPYTFPQPFVEGFVNIGTIKDDKVTVDLQLALRGTLAEQVLAIESANQSQQITSHSQTALFTIAALRSDVIFSGQITYDGFNLKDFESEFSAIEDVNTAKLALTGFNNEIRITIPLEQFVTDDLNSFDFNAFFDDVTQKIKERTGFDTTFRLGEETVLATIPIADEEEYSNERMNVFQVFIDEKDAGVIEDAILLDEQVELQGQIVFISDPTTGAVPIAEKTQELLLSKGFNMEVNQLGMIDTQTVTDELTGEVFTLQNPLRAVLKLGHKAGDQVNLKVDFIAQRREAFFAQASEVIN